MPTRRSGPRAGTVEPNEDCDIDLDVTMHILFGCVVHKKIPKTLKNG
jgi:hypothetical protein